MTEHQGQTAPAAGWYADPTGQAGVRWWDGGRWTAYTAPTPAGSPGAVVTARPQLSAETSVSTPFIWVMVFLPLLSIVALFLYRPDFTIDAVDTSDPSAPLRSVFTVGYVLLMLSSLVIYGLSVLFAFLDRRALLARGVVRPFAWPWAFLSGVVYVIGRSVIVRQVARPRGLGPVWALIAVMVVQFAASMVWTVLLLGQMTSQLSTGFAHVS